MGNKNKSSKTPSFHPFLTLPGVPDTARLMLARLLLEVPLPVASLQPMVAAYAAVITSKTGNGRTNVALGIAIASSLEKFLRRVDERTPAEELRVIQAAVRYFVIENDGFGSDLEHEDGLFGDARVVNAMLRWFGRDDLYVPVPVRAVDRVIDRRVLAPTLAMAS